MSAAELVLVEGGESEDSAGAGAAPRALRRAAVAVLGLGFGVAALAGVAAVRQRSVSSSLGHRTDLWQLQPSDDDTGMEFMDTVAGLPGIPYNSQQLQSLRKPAEPAPAPAPAAGAAATESATTVPPVPAMPQRATVNSNDCFKGEEFFVGACYKNCSALTAGQFTIRSSPNTCCSAEPCIYPSHLSFEGLFLCMGYAVDSKGECPRKPGHCNSDEELFEGMCYSPCATLTTDTHPYRAGPSTCCKYEPPCFNFGNLKSEGLGPCSGYNIGGAGHDCAHEPAT